MTAISLIPQLGVPMNKRARSAFLDRARGAIAVMLDAMTHGYQIPVPTEAQKDVARAALTSGRTFDINDAALPTLRHLDALLTEYDFELLDSARRLRNYVTNRLLAETENDDPKIRLRALELLGKTASAKVFSEEVNVNVTHRSIDEVDRELQALATKYMGDAQIVENGA